MGQPGQIHRAGLHIGVHANRRGVNQPGGVSVLFQLVIGVFPFSGNHHRRAARLTHHVARGQRCAAAAQHQHLLAAYGGGNAIQSRLHSRRVRIVPIQGAALAAHNGIDAADSPGLRADFRQIGDHRLLVGDGYVQPVKIAGA